MEQLQPPVEQAPEYSSLSHLEDEFKREVTWCEDKYIEPANLLIGLYDELSTRPSDGEYWITAGVIQAYGMDATLVERLGINRDRILAGEPIVSTNEEVMELAQCLAIMSVEEANDEIAALRTDFELTLIDDMLEEWWFPDDIAKFANCSPDHWLNMGIHDRWRTVAYACRDLEHVKGRFNYFRYYSPTPDETPQAERPAQNPYVDITPFIREKPEAFEAADVLQPVEEVITDRTPGSVTLAAIRKYIQEARQRAGQAMAGLAESAVGDTGFGGPATS